jgi:transcriptional regulator with XRE-family HTH domain
MKTLEQRDARRLRQQEGMLIRDIASILGVAKSSVSLWVRDIELSAQQNDILRLANPALNGQLKGQATCSRRARTERRAAQEQGRLQAKSGDELHRMGCMLYWAEGSKSRNAVQVVNSDPNMLKLFVRFLLECYGVVSERICLTLGGISGPEAKLSEVGVSITLSR